MAGRIIQQQQNVALFVSHHCVERLDPALKQLGGHPPLHRIAVLNPELFYWLPHEAPRLTSRADEKERTSADPSALLVTATVMRFFPSSALQNWSLSRCGWGLCSNSRWPRPYCICRVYCTLGCLTQCRSSRSDDGSTYQRSFPAQRLRFELVAQLQLVESGIRKHHGGEPAVAGDMRLILQDSVANLSGFGTYHRASGNRKPQLLAHVNSPY